MLQTPISSFRPKEVFTILTRVYLVKMNLYIYSVRSFLLYLMWDITNISSCRRNVLVVSHGITGSNIQIPHLGSKRTIFIRLEVSRYKWHQSRSLISMWGFIWPRKSVCLAAISWDTMRMLCLHRGVFVISHIGWREIFWHYISMNFF